jgi:hypothetical protein
MVGGLVASTTPLEASTSPGTKVPPWMVSVSRADWAQPLPVLVMATVYVTRPPLATSSGVATLRASRFGRVVLTVTLRWITWPVPSSIRTVLAK